MRDESEPERGSMLSGATRSLWQCPVLLIALRAMSTLTRGSSLKRGIRCAPLRAARNYVRYSATLRSYSGFVDVTERAVRQVHGLSQFAGEVR